MTRDQFIKQCITGRKFKPSLFNNGENGYGFTQEVQYWGRQIKKAAHVARNPLEVVQTRFEYITNFYNGELDYTLLYTPNKDGLYTWCKIQ